MGKQIDLKWRRGSVTEIVLGGSGIGKQVIVGRITGKQQEAQENDADNDRQRKTKRRCHTGEGQSVYREKSDQNAERKSSDVEKKNIVAGQERIRIKEKWNEECPQNDSERESGCDAGIFFF